MGELGRRPHAGLALPCFVRFVVCCLSALSRLKLELRGPLFNPMGRGYRSLLASFLLYPLLPVIHCGIFLFLLTSVLYCTLPRMSDHAVHETAQRLPCICS